MTKIVLNKDRILRLAQQNTKNIDNASYSYDREFDILRLKLGDTYGKAGTDLSDTVYAIFGKKGNPIFIEIYGFNKLYKLDNYKATLNNNHIIRLLEKIHEDVKE